MFILQEVLQMDFSNAARVAFWLPLISDQLVRCAVWICGWIGQLLLTVGFCCSLVERA